MARENGEEKGVKGERGVKREGDKDLYIKGCGGGGREEGGKREGKGRNFVQL